MIISLIVAASDNNAIGKKGELPWYQQEDLKYFKKTTFGKPVIMGRKTFESLGKQLPGRLNIVLTKNDEFTVPDGVLQYASLEDAIERVEKEPSEECFIIGGGKIFEVAVAVAERIYLTRVHTSIPDADAFFPQLDHTHWMLVWEEAHGADEKNQYPYTFQKYERTEL